MKTNLKFSILLHPIKPLSAGSQLQHVYFTERHLHCITSFQKQRSSFQDPYQIQIFLLLVLRCSLQEIKRYKSLHGFISTPLKGYLEQDKTLAYLKVMDFICSFFFKFVLHFGKTSILNDICYINDIM